MSLWQELESLQKKKAELEGQLHSFETHIKGLEERMRVIEEGFGLQEEHGRKLDVQLKERNESMNKLDNRLAGLEKILKKPAKEPVKEEAAKEEIAKEPAKPEPEIKAEILV